MIACLRRYGPAGVAAPGLRALVVREIDTAFRPGGGDGAGGGDDSVKPLLARPTSMQPAGSITLQRAAAEPGQAAAPPASVALLQPVAPQGA